MFAGTKPPLRCLNLEPLSCIFLTVKSFGKIAVCLAGGLALTAGLRADVPMDVFIILTMAEPPLVHHRYNSVAQARARRSCAATN